GAPENRRALTSALLGLAHGAFGIFLPALRDPDRARGGGLGELAGLQVVAQISRRHVDDGPALTQLRYVLKQDCLRHRCLRPLPVAVAVPVTIAAAATVVSATLGDVRQQRKLPGALDGTGH